jgi:hypothetical protein
VLLFRGGDECGMGGPCGVLRLQRALLALLLVAAFAFVVLVYWQKRVIPLDHLPAALAPIKVDR